VGKLFMGPDFQQAKQGLVQSYQRVQVIRPSGTRQVSSELFLVGLGLAPSAPHIDTGGENSASE
jgi:23S rRNA U2552 (ribose-2'-O)-methylase RlmE/FtsJ